MIQDTAKISMSDGTQASAIELFPGRQVLSFGHRHMMKARILDRKIESKTDVICLLLNNGQKLTGSRDQMVAVYRNHRMRFTPLADVEIGDHLRGERAGMPVIVSVIGLAFDLRKEVRLVSFQLDHDKTFVAEGVLCR